MVMSWIWVGIATVSLIFSILLGNGTELAAAVPAGAQAGIHLAISMSGAICLWTGVGKLMEKAGITEYLSALLRPLMRRVFPSTKTDPQLSHYLSANICANFLGLGNAATPMGILAVKQMKDVKNSTRASDEMCRLIVLNTASIQFIPATVAAVRASLGSSAPFDILPAVWITSICSAGLGLTAAILLGKVWRRD